MKEGGAEVGKETGISRGPENETAAGRGIDGTIEEIVENPEADPKRESEGINQEVEAEKETNLNEATKKNLQCKYLTVLSR